MLNFSNPSCTVATCSNKPTVGCLTAHYDNDFNSENLSCFTNNIDVNGNAYFCSYSFNFNNLLKTTKFTGSLTGQLSIKSSTGNAIDSQMQVTCYTYNSEAVNISERFTITDFIKNVRLGKNKSDELYFKEKGRKQMATGYRYDLMMAGEYYFKKIYSNIGNGKIIDYNYDENVSCTNCRFLGYGYISKLNLSTGTHETPFSYDYFKKDGTFENMNSNCEFEVKNNITTCEDKTCNSDGLNLEFRIIYTSNPFPGKSGSSRKTGENWCDGDNCGSVNSTVCSNIFSKKNSYTSGTAKYTIILNSDTVKTIRKANSDNKKSDVYYDDFSTLECDENNNCTSNYLKDLINKNILVKSENYDSKVTGVTCTNTIKPDIKKIRKLVM